MIDTVKIRFELAPTPEQIRRWVQRPLIFPDGLELKMFTFEVSLSEGVVKFVHYPENRKYGSAYLSIEASLPKLLYGNNIQMITNEEEVTLAAAKLNSFIAEIDLIPEIDVNQGLLSRLDIVYNHLVGAQVRDYIKALFRLTFPHRTTNLYKPEGVEFYSKNAKTKFYDKETESHNNAAHGILRHESQYRKSPLIAKKLDIDPPTLRNVTLEKVVETLQSDLTILRLDRTVITDQNNALNILMSKYKHPRAMALHGYLMSRQYMTRDDMLAKGSKLRTMQDYEKDIANAGLSMAIIDKGELPALKIEFDAQIRAKPVVKLEEGGCHE